MIWILMIGFFLRIINLNQSIWLDEGIVIQAVKNFSFLGIITQYAIADFHPPGYFIILWTWCRVFGFSEISARLPSLFFGIASILIVYLIGKRLLSKEFALIASLLLAINPLHIYYSQEARMYSYATFAVCLSFFLLLKFLKEGKISIPFLIIGNILVLSSDYVAYFIFPVQALLIFIYGKNHLFKKWIIGLVLSLICGIWWIPFFINQLNEGIKTSSNIPEWRNVVGSFNIKELVLTYVKFIIGRISLDNKIIYSVIFTPVGFIFAYIIFKGLKIKNNFIKKYFISWLLIPTSLALVLSLFVPVYSYFRVLFVLPAFIFLISLGLSSLTLRSRSIFLSVIIFIELLSSCIYLLVPAFHRENWKELINFLNTNSTKSKIIFESSGSFPPFDYYAGNNLKVIGGLKNFPAKNEKDLNDLEYLLKDVKDLYLLDYLVEISDPNRLIGKKILALGYNLNNTYNFNGVGFIYHYIKNE